MLNNRLVRSWCISSSPYNQRQEALALNHDSLLRVLLLGERMCANGSECMQKRSMNIRTDSTSQLSWARSLTVVVLLFNEWFIIFDVLRGHTMDISSSREFIHDFMSKLHITLLSRDRTKSAEKQDASKRGITPQPGAVHEILHSRPLGCVLSFYH